MSTTMIRVRFQADEGFLPRECPHCKREFNWFEGEAAGDAVVMSALDRLDATMRRAA